MLNEFKIFKVCRKERKLNQANSGVNHRKSLHLTYIWDNFQGTIYQLNSKVYMLKD